MSNAVMFITFKLKNGMSVPDFLLASEKVCTEFISKQKGYISWRQLVDGDMWADLVTWETMDDAVNASKASMDDVATCEFCSFLDQESVKHHLFSVKKDY